MVLPTVAAAVSASARTADKTTPFCELCPFYLILEGPDHQTNPYSLTYVLVRRTGVLRTDRMKAHRAPRRIFCCQRHLREQPSKLGQRPRRSFQARSRR